MTTPTNIPKVANPYTNATKNINANKTHNTVTRNLLTYPRTDTSSLKTSIPTNNSQSANKSGKLYSSTYIDDSIKPNNTSSIELPPELETLKPLIMSQPHVFKTRICDLGIINLSHTGTIEKKKENLNLLVNNKKIPRSLRIKCELSTSPDYASNQDFLRLKEELQNTVQDFISTGTKIMTEWAGVNILLLLKDRCYSIFSKALPMLDGLTSYYSDILSTPRWITNSNKFNTLILLKLYLSNNLIDTTELIHYFELPYDIVHLIGAKTLFNDDSLTNITNTFNSIDLNSINLHQENEYLFCSEILSNFDQILRVTTIDLWNSHTEKMKKQLAANNLKSKMVSIDTVNATAATASAINKAAELHNESLSQNLHTNLRLTNLEKSLRRQEQKTNEMNNTLQKNKNKNNQKNALGSHIAEYLTSPLKATLHKRQSNQRYPQDMVDLTNDTEDLPQDDGKEEFIHHSKYPQKNRKRSHTNHSSYNPSPPKKTKGIQWKNAEVMQYFPHQPSSTLILAPTRENPVMQQTPLQSQYANQPILNPFFQPAPPPKPLLAPSPNHQNLYQVNSPFHNSMPNPATTAFHTQNLFLSSRTNHIKRLQTPFLKQHRGRAKGKRMNQNQNHVE